MTRDSNQIVVVDRVPVIVLNLLVGDAGLRGAVGVGAGVPGKRSSLSGTVELVQSMSPQRAGERFINFLSWN